MALRTPAFNDARTYGFEWLRNMLEGALQEGVFDTNDFKVTAAAAGLQRVDVAAGRALVKGDTGVPTAGLSQGLYLIVNDAAIANAVTLTAAHATLPRLDQITLRVRDSADLGSPADDAVLEVVTGVPTAGATLDTRNGAAGVPNDAIRIADVLVPAASTAVVAGNVRDRRPWARGAFSRGVKNTGDAPTTGGIANYLGLTVPFEAGSGALLVKAHGLCYTSAAAASSFPAVLRLTASSGGSYVTPSLQIGHFKAGVDGWFNLEWLFGDGLGGQRWTATVEHGGNGVDTCYLRANGSQSLELIAQEVLGGNQRGN
jgi:hypothetical protein